MKTLHALFVTVICSLIFSIGAIAQPDPKNPENENLAVPANWEVRLDKPDESVVIGANQDSADIFFVNMVPGWHITTGPAAIFWHPESTAQDTYNVHTTIHLFDPKDRNEAFGIFFGGQNLDQQNQSYTYFLLRNSGQFLIKKRIGDETEVVKNWTDTGAMKRYTEATASSIANTLSVQVSDKMLTFLVNGEQVHSMPADNIATNGIAGLRINHALNVHVEDFGIEPLNQ